MLTLEEIRVLLYLKLHSIARMRDIVVACIPGTTPKWTGRILSNLEWLGYIAIFYDGGEPGMVQITEKGTAFVVSQR